MKNLLLLGLVSLIINSTFSQNYLVKYKENFDKALKLMQEGNIESSINYFTTALEFKEDINAYFNRGICYYRLNMHKNFCEDMKFAKYGLDLQATNLFDKECYDKKIVKMESDKVLLERKEKYDSVVDYIEISKVTRDSMVYFIKGDERIYSKVNYPPKYSHSDNSLEIDIAMSVKYPIEALNSNIMGTVFISFVVDVDGKITDIVIIKSPDELLSQAAIEAVKKINRFVPAKLPNETPVKYQLICPIGFFM